MRRPWQFVHFRWRVLLRQDARKKRRSISYRGLSAGIPNGPFKKDPEIDDRGGELVGAGFSGYGHLLLGYTLGAIGLRPLRCHDATCASRSHGTAPE